MYRRLEGTRIIETLQGLEQRIEERFPGSGLGRVSGALLAVANESLTRAAYLARPNLAMRWPDVAGFLRSSQAIQSVVFLGIAVLFLANAETRIKRHRALSAR